MHCWLSYSRSINSSWQQIADSFPSCLGVSRPCWCVVWEISGIFACVALHAEVLIVLNFFRKVLLGFWSFRWMATIVSWPDIRERPAPATVFVRFRGGDLRSSSSHFFFVWKSWIIIQGVKIGRWVPERLNINVIVGWNLM